MQPRHDLIAISLPCCVTCHSLPANISSPMVANRSPIHIACSYTSLPVFAATCMPVLVASIGCTADHSATSPARQASPDTPPTRSSSRLASLTVCLVTSLLAIQPSLPSWQMTGEYTKHNIREQQRRYYDKLRGVGGGSPSKLHDSKQWKH